MGNRRQLIVVAALLLGVVSACGTSSAAENDKPPAYPAGTSTYGLLPSSMMSLPFVDQDGRTVHLADFAGKTIVIQDIMTLCQELCPIDTSILVQAARDYTTASHDPNDVVFLSITVDPARDSPAQLAAYRRLYVGAAGTLPQWRLLTGTPTDVAALWKDLGVWVHRVPQDAKMRNWRTGQPLTYDVEHSDEAFFIDSTGHERYILDGMPALDGAPLPPTIQRFMSSDGHRNQRKPTGWTATQALGVLHWLTASQ